MYVIYFILLFDFLILFIKTNILRRSNFTGLPGESTMEPIHLLNNICEEARETDKELWILFQDIMKVYNSISLEILEKVLIRIKIPKKFLSLMLDPFKNRNF